MTPNGANRCQVIAEAAARARGDAYFHKKDYDNAVGEYTNAIRLDPYIGRSYWNRAPAYKAEGENSQAQADFDKAKQLGYIGGEQP
jgi:Tfp pilus assembly protein PilF